MLLEAAAVCAFVGFGIAAYSIRRTGFTVFLHQVKYNYIGFVYYFDDLRKARYNRIELPLLSKRVAVVTGGSRGIGAEVVKKLLRCDMDVVVACRRPAAGEKLVREIRKSGTTIGRAKVRELNLSSVKSIKAFADWVQREYGRVHMLINNAAVMFPPTYTETEDGFEEQWGVNYLSHFLLTALLLPCLQNAGQTGGYSRIVNVSSCALDIATIDFDYIRNSSRRPFNTYASYGQSKLAQIMFTLKLDKLLRDKSLKVQAYCVHPGIVRTDLFKETLLGRHKWLMIRWKTAEEGATPIVYTAVNKEVEYKGGLYISNCKELPIPPHALVEKTQKELFDLSLEQLQLRDFFQFL